ncbi:hypothetical protein ACFL29_02005 [Patescibacteria group bacterium]
MNEHHDLADVRGPLVSHVPNLLGGFLLIFGSFVAASAMLIEPDFSLMGCIGASLFFLLAIVVGLGELDEIWTDIKRRFPKQQG